MTLRTAWGVDLIVAVQSAWACVLMALVGFLLALNKERFPKMGVCFTFALLTYPIVAIPGDVSTSVSSRAAWDMQKGLSVATIWLLPHSASQ